MEVATLCPIVNNHWFTLLGGTGKQLELSDASITEALAQAGAAAALLPSSVSDLSLGY